MTKCQHCDADILSTSQPNRMGTTPEMQKMYDEFGGDELMTSDPAPEPCSDLSISELLEWLWNPQWTNGSLNSYAKHHMSAAAKLIEKLLGVPAALAATPPPITTEQLDKLQFGRVLHERPATPAGCCFGSAPLSECKCATPGGWTTAATPLRGREPSRETLKRILTDMIQRKSNNLVVVDYETTIDYILTAFSASPPEQPAADPYPSFAERNLIDRFGRHPKEQPAADQVTEARRRAAERLDPYKNMDDAS